jgi:hypothetical protein
MQAAQLRQLSTRHAVFVTTAMHMQHPGNDYDRWRRDWAEINHGRRDQPSGRTRGSARVAVTGLSDGVCNRA